MERKKPYNAGELFEEIMKRVEVPDFIEYTNPNTYLGNDKLIKSCEFDLITQTVYGSCEGVYTDVFIDGRYDKGTVGRVHLGTIKTLRGDREAVKKMYEFAADIYLAGTEFINKNLDDFTWYGYDLKIKPEDRFVTEVFSEERLIEKLRTFKKMNYDLSQLTIRDNSTRKYLDVSKYMELIEEKEAV